MEMGKLFSLPSQRNFPISFKPKEAIAEFFWKMQRKTWYSILGLDAMPLSLKNLLLRKNEWFLSSNSWKMGFFERDKTVISAYHFLSILILKQNQVWANQNKPQITWKKIRICIISTAICEVVIKAATSVFKKHLASFRKWTTIK